MALRSFVCLSSLAVLALAAPASAQNDQTTLVPGLERFELNGRPTAIPTARPTPRATPAPRATPTARATPAPRATPAARATPAPRATPTAQPTPAARVADPVIRAEPPEAIAADPPAMPLEPSPDAAAPAGDAAVPVSPAQIDQPLAPATPTPAVSDAALADIDTAGGPAWWIILLGLLVLAGIGAAGYVVWMRRQRLANDFEIEMTDIGGDDHANAAGSGFDLRPRPDADPAPAVPAPAFPLRPVDPIDLPPADAFPPAPPQSADAAPSPTPVFINDTGPGHVRRARLELTVRPQRAGTNLTSAAVDYEIDIANTGDADATGIRLDLRLMSASADQDAILTALYAAPIDKPIVAPFEIAAGEQVSLGGMALLPNEALSVMTVQGRDFFVPLLSLNLVYGWGDAAEGQTANAYVIGIERADGVKMAPFRLDTGARMYDRVGARAHTLTVNR